MTICRVMTIYCLTPQRNGASHGVHERCPGYPAREVGLLRPAYVAEHEGTGWIVRCRLLGHVYQGETPEAALATFDRERVRVCEY